MVIQYDYWHVVAFTDEANEFTERQTFSEGSEITEDVIDNFSWGQSSQRMIRRTVSQGTGSAHGANENTLCVNLLVWDVTDSLISYERVAIIGMAASYDKSDYSGGTEYDTGKLRDICGADLRGYILNNGALDQNLTGRAWGAYCEARTYDENSDGLLVGLEVGLVNMATVDQPLVGTVTSKYGIHVVAGGSGSGATQNGTAAIYINNSPAGVIWHKGIYASPSSMGDDAGDTFIELYNRWVVDYAGDMQVKTIGVIGVQVPDYQFDYRATTEASDLGIAFTADQNTPGDVFLEMVSGKNYGTGAFEIYRSKPSDGGGVYFTNYGGGEFWIDTDGDLKLISGKLGFYGAAPVAKPTGVAVTAAAIHAALVSLGLIAA